MSKIIYNISDKDNISKDTELEIKSLDKFGRAYATGRRKEAVARVWLKPGSGKFIVNNKELIDVLKRESLCYKVFRPFVVTSTSGSYDIFATVKGGGLSGRAGALIHGISRALDIISPELHLTLRKAGFLTRDSRSVERKKYGQHKARKKTQFSKR